MPIDREQVQRTADRLVSQGKLLAAIEQYSQLLKESPDDLVTINKIGDLYARIGRPADAVSLFARIATQYTDGGFFLKAIAIHKKILKLAPDQFESQIRLGDLYARQDLFKEAREMYNGAIQHLLATGAAARVRELYEKLLRLQPGSIELARQYADFLVAEGEGAAAAPLLGNSARLLAEQGRLDEAADGFRRALTLCVTHEEQLVQLARSAVAGIGAERFLPIVAELRAHAAARAPLLELQLEMLVRLGRRDEAAQVVAAEGRALPPAGPISRALTALTLARGGRSDDALAFAVQAVDELRDAGRADEAGAWLVELIDLLPDAVPLLMRRADLLREGGNYAAAGELTERIAQLFLARGMPEQAARIRSGALQANTGPLRPAGAPEPGRSSVGEGVRPVAAARRDEAADELVAGQVSEAEVLVRFGMYEEALAHYERAIATTPEAFDLRRRYKQLLFEAGHDERGIEECLELAATAASLERPEEARALLAEVLNREPGNSRAVGMMSMIQAPAAAAAEAGPAPAAPIPATPFTATRSPAPAHPAASQSFAAASPATPFEPARRAADEPAHSLIDLTDGLADSLAQAFGDAPEFEIDAPHEEIVALGDVLAAFRETVKREVEDTDFRTHYDLGIAYKEMGLLEEAIAEFEHAAHSDELYLDCCLLTAICQSELGTESAAEAVLRHALASALGEADEARRLPLQFELGTLLTRTGRIDEARGLFDEILLHDPTHPAALQAMAELRGALA